MGYKWNADMATCRPAVPNPLLPLLPLFLSNDWNMDRMDAVQAAVLRREVEAARLRVVEL